MKAYYVALLLVLATFCGCNKEKNRKWDVLASSIVSGGDHLIIINSADYNTVLPIQLATGSNNLVWEEDQHSDRTAFHNDVYDKSIVFEIPDSTGITSFLYRDEDIYTNLKCEVFNHCGSSKRDGYYFIHKGMVSGQKQSGQWIIDFKVNYGGEDDNKYIMTKGANY